MEPRVSIVIPTLNEADNIRQTLYMARSAFGNGAEYLVSDGGSTDRTVEVAEQLGAVVLEAPRGRGRQLQAGAQAARGAVILFLHADTHLPPEAGQAVEAALADPRVVGGAFRLRFDRKDGPLPFPLGLLARGINLRSMLFRTATGDQAVFVRKTVLDRIGGVPPVPLFEDVRLYRRMRTMGRVMLLKSSITTSARRWRKSGPIRLILLHLLLRVLHTAGVPPAQLVRLYR